MPGRPERIGHRGAPHEFAENSLEGFLRAVEMGADAVELDVHQTRDGVVVVHHDPEVTTPDGRKVAIASQTGAQIARCRLPGDLHIPTLVAVLDALGDRAMVYVELKGEGVANDAVNIALAYGKRYAFHSFDHQVIRELDARKLPIRLGVLIDRDVRDPVKVVNECAWVDDIWVHHSLADQETVNAVHAQGQKIICWTVNDPAEAKRLARRGVDGLCTDDLRAVSFEPVAGSR